MCFSAPETHNLSHALAKKHQSIEPLQRFPESLEKMSCFSFKLLSKRKTATF
jgi:hypothetical protein